MDFGRYYACVFLRALRDTGRFLWAEVRIEAAIVVAIFVVALLLQDDGSTTDQIIAALVFPLLALVFVAGSTFLWHLAWAPVATDGERRTRIAELEPRNTLVFEPNVVEDWVHVSVENVGETDNFIAQVTAVVGVEDMTVPWSIKWRQWEGEERRIIQGQAQLLDVAQVDHGYTYPSDPNALQGMVYYYNLISTTARFGVPGRLVGYLAKPDLNTLVDTLPEDTLETCIALQVEVRGVASRSFGRKWVSLGYRVDGTPVVSLADEEPELTSLPESD